MNNLRKKLKNISVIERLASVKIMVVCLAWLFILTFWGTVAQVNQGLYLAQNKFFYSWFFLTLGFIPLPGAQLTLWIMFINLVCSAIVHFQYKWSQSGILIIHLGLLSYLAAAFVVFHSTVESNLTLMEGEGSNVSSSYHDWELSVWPQSQKNNTRDVTAYDAEKFKPDLKLDFKELGFSVLIKKYFSNAQGYGTPAEDQKENFVNASGIKHLTAIAADKEPEKNLPGGIFEIQTNDGQNISLLLYGGEIQPAQIKADDKLFNFALRRKCYELPFTLTLKDFIMEKHPGTEVARSYESKVEVEHNGLSRDVRIYMNNPLRYKNFTLYQASYSIDELGREHSTLAVVKNAGRFLPYIASLITFAGLVVHFLIMGVFKKIKVRSKLKIEDRE